MASRIESHLYRDLSRRLHGTHDRVRFHRIFAKVFGNTIQFGQEPGKRIHGIDRRAWRMHWHLSRRMFSQTLRTETEGRCAIRAHLESGLSVMLRAAVLLGVRKSENGRHNDTVLQ